MAQQVDHDVIVVGAGLSGIGAAYRLAEQCPDLSFTVLEARDAVGGTWDLFRYPGVRSDSDMFTLGYPFRPWPDARAIADGPAILSYLHDTVRDFGLQEHIELRTTVVGAHWSTTEARWTVTLERREPDGSVTRQARTTRFLYFCGGYYSYDRAHDPGFAGVDDFAGDLVHPQFWPDDLDYTDRRVVVVGSGATAVTLVPAMAGSAQQVTMLQRSPSYILALPSVDPLGDPVQRWLPERAAHRVLRAKNVLVSLGFYQFSRRFPDRARSYLMDRVRHRLRGTDTDVDRDFNPRYAPWDQRLCLVPDADFFTAMRAGKASVVTGHIDRFVPEGVRLTDGRVIEADIVVAATGLSLQPLGGADLVVDGEPVDLGSRFMYRGLMLSGVPNAAVCIGYTNASWTLRADLSSRYVCRLLNHMQRKGYDSATPRPDAGLNAAPLLDLTSGYVRRAVDRFPKQGDRRPWRTYQNYLVDVAATRFGRVGTDMMFSRHTTTRAAAPTVKEPL